MSKRRHPFDIAVISLLLAIGMPCVVFMFGAVRSRQLQSKANPRWAQFSKLTAPDAGIEKLERDSGRLSVRTASIRSEPFLETEPIHQPAWDSDLTGSATGRRSMEMPVNSESAPQAPIDYDDEHQQRKPIDQQPIVFRPVENVRETNETEAKILQSTQMLESRLTEIRQRLEQLAHQQQSFSTDELQRDAQLFEALKQLNESIETRRSSGEARADDARADEKPSADKPAEATSSDAPTLPETLIEAPLPGAPPAEANAANPFDESKGAAIEPQIPNLIEMDTAPVKVEFEAKILRVRLSGRLEHGVDMSQLPCRSNSASIGEQGLKQSSLSCSVPTFIRSLGRMAETRVVSSQHIQVMNNHEAELLIGNRMGLQSKPGEGVQFAESGARLLFRPRVLADGSIQVQVHPERSNGTVARGAKLVEQISKGPTTQVQMRDGSTIAVGGLISEPVIESPGHGSFIASVSDRRSSTRHRNDGLQRTETIILLTVHIVAE